MRVDRNDFDWFSLTDFVLNRPNLEYMHMQLQQLRSVA